MNRRFFVLLFLLLAGTGVAQTVADNRRRYESAKDLLKQGKYDLAQELLRPLLRETPENPFAAYARYFTALADFKASRIDQARTGLSQLLDQYANWPDRDQARYLLANVQLVKKDYAAALQTVAGLGKNLSKDVENLKKHYLRQEPNTALLKELQRKNPDDAAVAEVLAERLRYSSDADEQALAKKLDSQFNFKKNAPNAAPAKKTDPKAAYNVAVVLPFEYAKLAAEKSGRASPIAVDMYNGIRLAQKQLAREESPINLFAYDVGADADKMMETVNQPGFKASDLVIGPINGAAIRVAVGFANETGIGQINPITTNSQIVQNTAAAYLFQASLETQARQAARFARKQFSLPTAAILFGGSARDSLLADAYRRAFVQAGGKVSVYRSIKAGSDLTQMAAVVEQRGLGHVFVSTTNETVVLNLVSALEKLSAPLPVITQTNWLTFPMLSYDQLERLQVHFISPDFIDYRSEAAIAFRQAYVAQYNLVPSLYAYQGYDMMLFFGRVLKTFGTNFHAALKSRPPVKGDIFPGYDYRNANDNQYVPIARFENGNYVLVNPVE